MTTRSHRAIEGACLSSVCVIGAGSSGIAACQVLQARGIDFDCYETGSEVGGNWRYLNDNGMSSSYRSLHINTSREIMEYKSFPMRDDYPTYPNHVQIAHYFDTLRRPLRLPRPDPVPDRGRSASSRPASGEWDVTVRRRDAERHRDAALHAP